MTYRTMTDNEIEVLFRTWWSTSYPTPPGTHTLLTHIVWARFLLEQIGDHQPKEPRQ